MTEQKERLVYRTCPCFTNDIEGIQTWLEDLAKEGLFPQPDSRFLSVFSFRKGVYPINISSFVFVYGFKVIKRSDQNSQRLVFVCFDFRL